MFIKNISWVVQSKVWVWLYGVSERDVQPNEIFQVDDVVWNNLITSLQWDFAVVLNLAVDSNYLWWFATSIDLTTAHPTASVGEYALVWETNTFWVWDSWTNTWINSGSSNTPNVFTKINITGLIAPNTTLNLTGDWTNYTKEYSNPNLGTSALIFKNTQKIEVFLNWCELEKWTNVLWVSATQIQLSEPVNNWDWLKIIS